MEFLLILFNEFVYVFSPIRGDSVLMATPLLRVKIELLVAPPWVMVVFGVVVQVVIHVEVLRTLFVPLVLLLLLFDLISVCVDKVASYFSSYYYYWWQQWYCLSYHQYLCFGLIWIQHFVDWFSLIERSWWFKILFANDWCFLFTFSGFYTCDCVNKGGEYLFVEPCWDLLDKFLSLLLLVYLHSLLEKILLHSYVCPYLIHLNGFHCIQDGVIGQA